MTSRHRVWPILVRLFCGVFFGGQVACGTALALLGVLWLVGLDNGVAAVVVLPVAGAAWLLNVIWCVQPELERQRGDYRLANNRCATCDDPLRGIRGSTRQCPECGKLFKPTH